MASARLVAYQQNFGSDTFRYRLEDKYLEIDVGWGLMAGMYVTIKYISLNRGQIGETVVKTLDTPRSANSIVRELGYEKILCPPWLREAVDDSNGVG